MEAVYRHECVKYDFTCYIHLKAEIGGYPARNLLGYTYQGLNGDHIQT
jgi:hypothetical protein